MTEWMGNIKHVDKDPKMENSYFPIRLHQRGYEGAGLEKASWLPASWMLNLWDVVFEHLKASRVHLQIQLLTVKTASASKGLYVDSKHTRARQHFLLHNSNNTVGLRNTRQFISEGGFVSASIFEWVLLLSPS